MCFEGYLVFMFYAIHIKLFDTESFYLKYLEDYKYAKEFALYSRIHCIKKDGSSETDVHA